MSTVAEVRSSLPTVFAIVVNYNGWSDTIECVESLLRGDYPALRILVLDNASTNGSLERIHSWARGALPKPNELAVCTRSEIEGSDAESFAVAKLMLVQCGTNLGFAGANNIGLRHVLRSDRRAYALLLNNDAVIASDGVGAMVNLAERTPDMGAVGATILRHDQPERVEMFAGATVNRVNGMVKPIHAGARRSAPRPSSLSMDYVSGCCLLVGASAIERVGLMDERYFLYSEDVDWGLRMTRAGLRLAYCPSAEVWHKGGASVVHRSVTHDYYMVRGGLMLVQKHFKAMLPAALVYWLWRAIMPKLVRREWARLRAASRGYRDFVLQALRPARVERV